MRALNVLIIEDEPHAQKELKRLLQNCEFSINILEYIDSIEYAVEWLHNNDEPDLMFFDIQLSDGLSFEIFNQIKIKAPIIFTTAFDEYAIKAFKVNSIDYLLKPIKQNDLEKAIGKYFELINNSKGSSEGLKIEQIEKLLEFGKTDYKSRFITRIGDQIKYINVNEIAYFKAEDNEVILVTKQNKNYFINYSLEQLSKFIDPKFFFRANRTYYINIESIIKISKHFNSRIKLELQPASTGEVLISRVKVADFLNWIEK